MVQSGIIILNDQKRIVVWNNWIEKFSDLSRELALGKVLDDVFPFDRLSRIFLAANSAIVIDEFICFIKQYLIFFSLC